MLRVEIADTPYKMAEGLMFRKSMPTDEGMIFLFKKSDNLRFWGVNTFIPLDIAFVNRHGRIVRIAEIKPMSDRGVESGEPACIAIEANSGYFAENSIKAGDIVEFNRQTDRHGVVSFRRGQKTAQQLIEKPQERPWGAQNHQISAPPAVPTQFPVINEDNAQPQLGAQPIAPTADNPQGLPVIDVSDLQGILEDSYDESGLGDEETDPDPDAVEPPPEISPENKQQEEEPEPFPNADEDDYPDFGSPAAALQWAQTNHEVVHIWYKTKGGRDIEREIEPHGHFVADSTGNQIVVCFDDTIGDIRAFIVPNVLFFTFAGREFQPKFVVKG